MAKQNGESVKKMLKYVYIHCEKLIVSVSSSVMLTSVLGVSWRLTGLHWDLISPRIWIRSQAWLCVHQATARSLCSCAAFILRQSCNGPVSCAGAAYLVPYGHWDSLQTHCALVHKPLWKMHAFINVNENRLHWPSCIPGIFPGGQWVCGSPNVLGRTPIWQNLPQSPQPISNPSPVPKRNREREQYSVWKAILKSESMSKDCNFVSTAWNIFRH